MVTAPVEYLPRRAETRWIKRLTGNGYITVTSERWHVTTWYIVMCDVPWCVVCAVVCGVCVVMCSVVKYCDMTFCDVLCIYCCMCGDVLCCDVL